MTTALEIISELKSGDIVAKISASLGKPVSDPSVLKFITGAIMTIQEKPELARCSKQSIIDSVVNAASVQLPVDNQHLAYLVPRGGICCFQPSYMGYIAKIKESDPTADFTVCPVYKGDKFTFSRKDGQVTYEHIVSNPFEDKPINMVGMYVYIKTSTSSHMEVLSQAELMKIKASSPNSSGAIWSKWEMEMLKGKAIRRASKTKFQAAVAKLNALADIADGITSHKEAPKLATVAPLPEESVQEAEVVEEHATDELPPSTPEELADLESKKAAARQKLAEMEEKDKADKDSTESPKIEPTKPQALPDGHMQATGIVVSRGEPNRGGYVKYNLEGVKDDLGYDIGFSTCDPTIIETLNTRLENMAPACIEYTVSHTGKYTNYNIIGLIAVE